MSSEQRLTVLEQRIDAIEAWIRAQGDQLTMLIAEAKALDPEEGAALEALMSRVASYTAT
jgi:hypothetical protein